MPSSQRGGQPELCTEAVVPSPQTRILTLGLRTGPGLQAENAGLGDEEKEAEDGPHGPGPRSGSDEERLEMKSKTRGAGKLPIKKIRGKNKEGGREEKWGKKAVKKGGRRNRRGQSKS